MLLKSLIFAIVKHKDLYPEQRMLRRLRMKTNIRPTPWGRFSPPTGGWGVGARPSPRTNKENPRRNGDFPETADAVIARS